VNFGSRAVCPHKGDAVLGRGIIGDSCGTAKVACPFHKRAFSLETGQCTRGEGTSDLPPCEEHPNKLSTAAQ
jgi:nitrite reductase/ring-hydroxylating ferredoxin subunit